MATWPTVSELKARLDVTSDDWDDQLTRLLDACIAETKARVGEWVEGVDTPTDSLAQSALERAVDYGTTGGVSPTGKAEHLLYGHRRRFGTA